MTTETIDVDAVMGAVHARLLQREGVILRAPNAAASAPDGRFAELRRNEAYHHHQYGAFGREVNVKRGGWKGRAEFFLKRAMRKLLGWYVKPQVDFNASVTRAIAEATRHLEALATEIEGLRAENVMLKQQLHALAHPDHGIDYHRFEGHFRGERAVIKENQRPYVACFDAPGPVLDVGCGRGEFLELLGEAGVSAYGVDLDAGMAASARAHGLRVEVDDAFAHLRGLGDATLGGVYIAQVVEHMAPGRVAELLRLAFARMAPGAVLIAETPNSICEPAMRNFYLDPTHVRPVHPLLLRFLAEEAGFAFDHYVFTSAMPGHTPDRRTLRENLDREDVSQYRDYAVVMRKP